MSSKGEKEEEFKPNYSSGLYSRGVGGGGLLYSGFLVLNIHDSGVEHLLNRYRISCVGPLSACPNHHRARYQPTRMVPILQTLHKLFNLASPKPCLPCLALSTLLCLLSNSGPPPCGFLAVLCPLFMEICKYNKLPPMPVYNHALK